MEEQSYERRRHTRHEVFFAAMVTPNGDQHDVQILDLSLGGARMTLPSHWSHSDGTALKVLFEFGAGEDVVLMGRVTRTAIDHLGLEFAPGQEAYIRQVLEILCR